MKHWLDDIRGMVKQHGKVVLVSVALIRGSTPREAGAHMIVSKDGIAGTIGGGNLEFKAIEQAKELLKDGDETVLYQDYPLGPALGQCCGGVASLLFETVDQGASWIFEESRDFISVSQIGSSSPRQILYQDDTAVKPLLPKQIMQAASKMTVATLLLEEEGYFLEKVEDSRIALYIYGAGHVAQALVSILTNLPFKIHWIDNREDMFDGVKAQEVQTEIVAHQESVAKNAPDGAFHLIMTHDHGIDMEITHAVLSENRFGYLGLIGSDTKRVRFERRLKARGIDAALLDKMICPIGLPEITGKRPGEVALSVAAELTILSQEMVKNMKEAEGNNAFGG